MKAIKYLLLGVFAFGATAPLAAQDNKAVIDEITKVIKSKQATPDVMKAYYKKNKKNAEVLVGVGRAFYAQKDTANAHVWANYAQTANKKYAPAFLLLGDIAALGEDGGKAANFYDQAIYFDPKNPEGYYKYASVYRKVNPDDAVAKLELLRTQRPDIAVEARAGHIFYISNDFNKAEQYFAKVDRSKLGKSDITEYGMSLYLLQKYAESLDIVKFGLQSNPRDASFNRLAMFDATELKQFDDAMNYADCLFNKSDSANISYFDYTYYGNALSGAKKHAEAIDMYKKALEQEIDNQDKRAGVLKTLAEAYKQEDNYAEAIPTYEKYLTTLSKTSATDYAGLATLYTQYAGSLQGDQRNETFKKADGVYAQMAEKYPSVEEFVLFMRARVNSYMDPETKEGLARPYYEKLVSLLEPKAEKDKSDTARLIESYRYLGYYNLLQEKDDHTVSNGYWQKLLAIDPNNEVAKQALGANL